MVSSPDTVAVCRGRGAPRDEVRVTAGEEAGAPAKGALATATAASGLRSRSPVPAYEGRGTRMARGQQPIQPVHLLIDPTSPDAVEVSPWVVASPHHFAIN